MSQLEERLHELESASRPLLLENWQVVFRQPPPKNLSTKLIRRAVTYELQVKQQGGLPVSVRKNLREIALNDQQGFATELKPPKPQIKSGTKLLREWNGRTYEVEVLDVGFIWNGVTYKSLSAIARVITGAHWSGPRFFGLQVTLDLQSTPDLKSTLHIQSAPGLQSAPDI